jgi:hypothetical protein
MLHVKGVATVALLLALSEISYVIIEDTRFVAPRVGR